MYVTETIRPGTDISVAAGSLVIGTLTLMAESRDEWERLAAAAVTAANATDGAL